MTEPKENPYIKMPDDVFKEHLTQLKTVVDEKKIDVTQFFGEPITKEDKEKLEKVDTLQTQVDTLSEEKNKKDLSETEEKLAQANIDNIVGDIKKIDKDAPLDTVLKSNFNALDKLEILKGTRQTVEFYAEQMNTLREQIPSQGTDVNQRFSKPAPGADSAESIIKSMTPEANK